MNRLAILVCTLLGGRVVAAPLDGHVVDATTGRPIAAAVVTAGETVASTDADGAFRIEAPPRALGVRAVGYERRAIPLGQLPPDGAAIPLAPFRPKALYLSVYGIGHAGLRGAALALLARTELNALVIDVKGDTGRIPYRSDIPLAAQVGAQSLRTIQDLSALTAGLRARGIYTIARIVVFKDAPLALGHPELAVRGPDGQPWRDREGLAWTDPFRRAVWDYNIDVAVEAARGGFDEIQFDYLRFPDHPGLCYALPSTERGRIDAISGFLVEARRRLVPYNVFLSADVFGYVCWNLNDTMIGQRIEDLTPLVDYVSPMLYPSSFQFGIPGYRAPLAHPQEIVYRSLARAQERTGVGPIRFRPWLQAFRDYAFDRRPWGGREIRIEIAAAEAFGSNGWMLWNAHNAYTDEGLRQK